jgi:hypothetical protein
LEGGVRRIIMDTILWTLFCALFIVFSILIKRLGACRINLIGIVVLYLMVGNEVLAQVNVSTFSNETKNVWYLEAAGNGGIVTVNYERFLTQNVSLRIGIGTAILILGTAPVMVNFCVGKDHRVELGLGITVGAGIADFDSGDYKDESGVVGTATVGYRY